MSEELKDCPCGKKATQRTEIFMSGERLYPQVKCGDRHCCFGKWWHDKDKWNTRAPDPRDKLIEEMAEALAYVDKFKNVNTGISKDRFKDVIRKCSNALADYREWKK